jgi:phosphoribosylanthranilate isomerase
MKTFYPFSADTMTKSSRVPRIQIAGISSLKEALYCAEIGVDALGFTLELPSGIHDGLTASKARSIISKLPEDILSVLITYLTSASLAATLLEYIKAGAIQFHGGISVSEMRVFRRKLPDVFTIGRVSVTGPESLYQAKEFDPVYWDAIILDSVHGEKIGATGRVHDWAISRSIVKQSAIPVILAGGLNPLNIRDAIFTVRPSGVDVHSGIEDADGKRNWTKLLEFTTRAVSAFDELKKRKHR